ncbi:MAG: ATP-binding cassette domain-containing protein [candidate division Zixibacteria bacterium]|nr:ATP-binding cassette domain-containing protein [candidate division Zixibacteria bacterium]
MAFIEFKDLSKRYDGDVIGITDFNLEIEKGEFIILLGPSGCGKSTLLRLVAGLEQPTTGRIVIDNATMNNMEPKNRDVAMVFQEYALYPHLTVRDNLAFPLKMKKVRKDRIEEAVAETASLVDLTDLLQRKPKQLSGGQRQRVALGRALIRQPKVFLFDEPLSNLDFNLRVNLRREITELHKKTGITTIYVTHDQQEALALGDRIGILNKGRLIQCDIPEKLFSRPKNLFVATFIGNPRINIINGRIERDKRLFLSEGVDGISIRGLEERYADKPCLVGIRAHQMEIGEVAKEQNGDIIVITAVVQRVENQGDYYLIDCLWNEQIIVVKTSNKDTSSIGRSCKLSFKVSDLLIFDPETGGRIFP